MGGCVSATPEEREAKLRSAAIDRQLRTDLREYENTIKILLLGAGESGKSTVVKQMKIIHGDGYSQQELESFTPVIYGNLASSMRVVVTNMEKLGIPFSNPVNRVCKTSSRLNCQVGLMLMSPATCYSCGHVNTCNCG